MKMLNLQLICGQAALFSCLSSTPLMAQVVAAGFSPVPLWPSNGIVSQEMKNQHVFLDPVVNQIVISYTDDQGVAKLARFDREDRVDLGISATVTVLPDGRLNYDYIVQNGGKAKRALREWTLIVGAPSEQITATHVSWSANQHASPVPRPGSIRPEAALTWNGSDKAPVVPALSGLSGFRLVSSYKPGITLAYGNASVPVPYTEAVGKTLPPAVQQELASIVSPTWNAAQVLTIGPKFLANDPKALIAMDFHRGINQLITHQVLTRNSPFVSAAMSSLEAFMGNTQSGGSPALYFLDKAAAGLESEIASAMAISLR